MNLYAFKTDKGYLKLAEDMSYTIVGMNKASVYDNSCLGFMKEQIIFLKEKLINLRIVKLVLEEEDYFIK
ncbi:MAG: hypothetical protein RR614_04615 [Eubacterium sp.]